MTQPYILYGSPGTASLCVHWLLIELGVPFEFQNLDFEAGDQRDAEYLRLNPQGRVPTLVIEGRPMSESAAILMLLAERHGEAGLSPAPGAPNRAAFLQTMIFLANTLLPAYRNWFYAEKDAVDGVTSQDAAAIQERARLQIEAVWARIDADLADQRRFILGAEKTVADHLLTMLTRWSRNMQRPATDWPMVKAYVDRMRKEPALREVHRCEGLTDWIDD